MTPEFWVGHLSSSKKNGRFYFVSVCQKSFHMFFLELIIVLINLGPEFDFLYVDRFLIFLGLSGSLLFLLLVAAIVGNTTHRWLCCW